MSWPPNGTFEEQLDGKVVFYPLTDLHERDLDAVAATLADAGLPDHIDVDAALASCVQLSLSTPTAPTAVSTAYGLVAFAQGTRRCFLAPSL